MEQKQTEAFNDIFYEIEAYECNEQIAGDYYKYIRGMMSICSKLGLLSSHDRYLLSQYLDKAKTKRGITSIR